LATGRVAEIGTGQWRRGMGQVSMRGGGATVASPAREPAGTSFVFADQCIQIGKRCGSRRLDLSEAYDFKLACRQRGFESFQRIFQAFDNGGWSCDRFTF
jgi:hypothetical protein